MRVMSDFDKTDNDLQRLMGRVLVAMPNMGDPRFHRAVVLLCAHDDNGAMGLVINHVLPGVDMRHLLEQLHIEITKDAPLNNIAVMSGGPVENARGFILHTHDFHQDDTIRITSDLAVTGTVDALRSVAAGTGPEKMVFILGYAGWTEGQLESEIQQNVWLVCDADPELIFNVPPEEKWNKAIGSLGIDLAMLSGETGRA
jgi:putative transcriptional regulator